MNKLLSILISFPIVTFGQTYVPDSNFEKGIYYFHIKTNEGAINKKVIYQ